MGWLMNGTTVAGFDSSGNFSDNGVVIAKGFMSYGSTPSVSGAAFAASTNPTSTTGEIAVTTAGPIVLTPGINCTLVGANAHIVGAILNITTPAVAAITARTATTITFTGVAAKNYDYSGMSCG